ncbi:MAG: 4-(cytidine 5'-diphospho)-2-C-methyl-D-erythritol kinase [Christensenellaceae bacterium]
MIRVRSYAKINLSLNITGTAGGYHTLKSVVASVDLSDTILLSRRKDPLSRITMHGMGSESIPPERNLALRAAELYSRTFQTNGADITVWKDIPMGGGLGGSSADTAGVLVGMRKLYKKGSDEELKSLADSLGSDTGYMLKGGYALLEGRGERVTPLTSPKPLYLLLFLPKAGVSTPACYQKYDEMPDVDRGQTEACLAALTSGNVADMVCYNSLTAPAAALSPLVKETLLEAQSFSPIAASMTGSGSCVFALFETRELCEWAKSRYRGASRTVVVKTIEPKQFDKILKNPFVLGEDEGKNGSEEKE